MPLPRQFTPDQVRWVRESGLPIAQMARELGASETAVRLCRQGRTYQNTSPSDARPTPDPGAPAPSDSTTVQSGGDVAYSGVECHAPEGGGTRRRREASLTAPADAPPASAGAFSPPEQPCSACGQEAKGSDTDLCADCEAKVKVAPGAGDGPLPHYDLDGPLKEWRERSAKRGARTGKSVRKKQRQYEAQRARETI